MFNHSSKADEYHKNIFREITGPKHRTDWLGRKIFRDGSTYSRDVFSGKVTVKRPPPFW